MRTIDLQHPLTVCRASAGTGKTYTLAAYYIAMLLSGESYRNILAVTFTNAATAEMKERILTYLLGIAQGREKEFLHVVRQYMLRDDETTDEVLQKRAQTNLHAILQDYDNFSVTTIDSFLQQLIRGMAKAINRTADFTISLDEKQVITEAVDTMLTTELTEDSKQTVFEYVEECIGDSRNWDIRSNLIRIAQQLYRESVQVHSTHKSGSSLDLDEKRIAAYKQTLYAQQKAALKRFHTELMPFKNDLDAGMEYAKKGYAKTAIENLCDSVLDPQAVIQKDKEKLFRGATEKGMEAMLAHPQLAQLQRACDEMRHTWWQTTCSLTYLNDMRLMGALEDSIRKSLLRTNTALLADTAVTLAQALQPGDADFILEKAGIRYRHIMIDEFQDTSQLQWDVFLHLINEVVAVPGQTVLIVGDTKQSIYRFRNGQWQIMERLGKTELQQAYNPRVKPLIRNQRSRREVVAFNMGVMKHVAQQDNLQLPVSEYDTRPVGPTLYGESSAEHTLNDYYRAGKHEGGYVRCRFYPYYDKRAAAKMGTDRLLKEPQQQALWNDVCCTIEELLSSGEQPQDILILGRNNKDIQDWVTFCRLQTGQYPLLDKTQMVSRDSFKLDACPSVVLLIEALRYMHTGSEAAAAFVRMYRENDDLQDIDTIDKHAPLYDQLQQLLQTLLCEQGTYQGEDVAYINSLLDQVQTFVAVNGSDATALLQYWEDTMHDSAISGDSNSRAIKLMTVHSSKGLEGKTVIILGAAWETEKDRQNDILWSEPEHADNDSLPYIPVKQDKDLQRTGEQSQLYNVYKQEHEAQLIDNYNLLYVALTRAADNLYIYALIDTDKYKEGYPTVAASLLDYTGLRDSLRDVSETEESTCLEFTHGTVHIHRPEQLPQPGDTSRRESGNMTGKPFDYTDTEPVPTLLYSDGAQVHFRQSQESTLYTVDPDNAETATAQADFGVLCHEIFSRISCQDEAMQVVESYRQQGLIDNQEQQQQIEELIRRAFESERMRNWFDGSWELMREAAIITPTTLIRPDRVMIKEDRAVILDYKFTRQQKPSHVIQVRDYMAALQNMHYTHVEGWLWYAFSNQLVQVFG